MPTVLLQGSYISQSDIQKCVDVFEQMSLPETEKIINISAEKKIDGFDPLIIAYLVLFKIHYSEVTIQISLPLNTDNTDKVLFQLKQFNVYAYLVTGINVFYINNVRITNLQPVPPKDWLVYSEDFFPILVINGADSEQFELLFELSLNALVETQLNEIESGVVWDSSNEKVNKNYKNHIIANAKLKDRRRTIINLARIGFYNCLNEAKICNFFFEHEYNIDDYDSPVKLQAGNLRAENAYRYYQSVKPIFDELSTKSLFHQFLFSIILSSELLTDKESGKDTLTDATKDIYINKLFSLWSFTQDLVAGIKELAKNVREHSKPSIGAVCTRIFKKEKWKELKQIQEINNFWGDEKKISLIDINVIDLGSEGVISTLIKNSQSILNQNKNSSINTLIQEDIENLTKSNIRFQNLLDTSTKQLNQQAKRSIAHFGLLTLSKLVEINKGLILASSYSSLNSNDREKATVPKELGTSFKFSIKIGTNFNIVLPIKISEAYRPHLSHMALPSETSARDIKGMEELLNYHSIKINNENSLTKIEKSKKYILIIDALRQPIDNREQEYEFWEKIKTQIKTRFENCLYCINLNEFEINESQLFRLLGSWELDFPGIPLILTNVKNETLQKLLTINRDFTKINTQLDYWNEKIAILIYSYIKVLDSERFYFADILWGKNRIDYISLNWLTNRTNFNSITWQYKKDLKKEIENQEKIITEVNPNTDLMFNNKNNLLSFDLILKGANENTTLFEHNAIILLNNEIKT